MQRELAKKKMREMGMEKEDEDENQDSISSLGFNRPLKKRNKILEPRSWDEYFEQKLKLSTSRGEFCTYWSPPSNSKAPIFICQHGAGSSGLTFALLTKTIRKKMKEEDNGEEIGGVLAFDMRGHGETQCEKVNEPFALNTLVEDFFSVVERIQKEEYNENPLILIGHSLGGSIVADAAMQKRLKNVAGLVVLDVVEGLTIEALDSMNKVLSTFPPKFSSLNAAIEWHLSQRHLRDKESAAVSVPPLLKKKKNSNNNNEEYTWIMDLKSTEKYWKEWFEGLSGKFLKSPAARLLILAGTDRLDKELMIGQMQGKYQLMVFNEAGHFLQEDCADRTAVTLIDFWQRNGRPANIIPVFGKFRNT